MEIHVRRHEGSMKYKCEICNKAFIASKDALDHKYVHTGETPFSCEYCAKAFASSKTLYCHKMNVHYQLVTGKPRYYCTTCEMSFKYASCIKQHNITHHNAPKPDVSLLCVKCGKRFSGRDSLHVHSKTHTGEKPFTCSFCGKCFARATFLKTHEHTHTGERPHICEICGKGFSQRTSMKNHQKIHTGQGKEKNEPGQDFHFVDIASIEHDIKKE